VLDSVLVFVHAGPVHADQLPSSWWTESVFVLPRHSDRDIRHSFVQSLEDVLLSDSNVAPVLVGKRPRILLAMLLLTVCQWRLMLAGVYPVEWRDFYMGDMFCSLTYSMSVGYTRVILLRFANSTRISPCFSAYMHTTGIVHHNATRLICALPGFFLRCLVYGGCCNVCADTKTLEINSPIC
jgi:hypothetical protein